MKPMQPVGAIWSTDRQAYVLTLWVRNRHPNLARRAYMLPLVAHVEATRMMGVTQSRADKALRELRGHSVHHFEVSLKPLPC